MANSITLTNHLIEIRLRLVYCILFFFLSFCISYCFVEHIYNFLLEPLAKTYGEDHHRRIIYTGVSEAFTTYVRLAFLSALFFSAPFFMSQFYLFLAPGLYKKEKKLILSLLIMSPLLFLIGSAFLYYFVFPAVFKFFVSFESNKSAIPIELEARISEYLSLVVKLIFGFGIAFQLPIVIIILVKIGVVKVQTLRSKRKYWIVLIFIIAAVLTPPDVFSQISMALPMMLLYEIAILISARIK